MRPFALIRTICLLSGAALAYDHADPTARGTLAAQFQSGPAPGAKFVSTTSREQPKSLIQMIVDMTAAMENNRRGYGKDGLDALRARTLTEQSGGGRIKAVNVAEELNRTRMGNHKGLPGDGPALAGPKPKRLTPKSN